ncbi:hypothetical protein GCM10020366_53110 [Saccharopolyspora gregorii]|uniref:Uncharacterized protein n=1 Tax=Saccharopolyspora gregorii TaxID=33914 RepID=A0ABP6RXT6_9PSEU
MLTSSSALLNDAVNDTGNSTDPTVELDHSQLRFRGDLASRVHPGGLRADGPLTRPRPRSDWPWRHGAVRHRNTRDKALRANKQSALAASIVVLAKMMDRPLAAATASMLGRKFMVRIETTMQSRDFPAHAYVPGARAQD